MTSRRLQQIHPPLTEPSAVVSGAVVDPAAITGFDVTVSSPGRWEGSVRLEDGRTMPYLAIRDGQQIHVWIAGESFIFGPSVPVARSQRVGKNTSEDIVCPVPGVVIAVHVVADDIVEAGQDLVIIESMKTEQVVKSPRQGTVQRVSVQEGDRVDRGMRLVVLVPLTDE